MRVTHHYPRILSCAAGASVWAPELTVRQFFCLRSMIYDWASYNQVAGLPLWRSSIPSTYHPK